MLTTLFSFPFNTASLPLCLCVCVRGKEMEIPQPESALVKAAFARARISRGIQMERKRSRSRDSSLVEENRFHPEWEECLRSLFVTLIEFTCGARRRPTCGRTRGEYPPLAIARCIPPQANDPTAREMDAEPARRIEKAAFKAAQW